MKERLVSFFNSRHRCVERARGGGGRGGVRGFLWRVSAPPPGCSAKVPY